MSSGAGPISPVSLTRFSPDGMWWWDGAEWKPAVSPDRLWRWTGTTWVPAVQAAPIAPARSGVAAGIIIAVFVGVLIVAAVITAVVLVSLRG